ncbi:MAG: DUF3309 family protein [Phyllobacterium sp.]
MNTALIATLVVPIVAALPVWPHARKWGYMPVVIMGSALFVLIILALLGQF